MVDHPRHGRFDGRPCPAQAAHRVEHVHAGTALSMTQDTATCSMTAYWASDVFEACDDSMLEIAGRTARGTSAALGHLKHGGGCPKEPESASGFIEVGLA